MMAAQDLVHRWRQELALWTLPQRERQVIRCVKRERLAYLSTGKLVKLARLSRSVRDGRVPGLFIECGCALGGSAIVLAACKGADRELRVYDVFGMIPPPTAADGPDVHARYAAIKAGRSAGLGDDPYYGYMDDLYEVVKGNFARLGYPVESSNVALVKGLLQETLVLDEAVAVAHVDVDWYESVRVSIERIWPRLSIGGVMVFDDYYFYSGCRQAVDAFLVAAGADVALDEAWGSLAITRVR